ncbi:Mur ligase domain-containing protein [Pontiellaceae bacterium B12227]|nr:Mur ligase domain-containing protein [Pontiellaceae bacterium B12227]
MKRVHFIGIGGVGMNGLAQLAAQSGYAVSGSDRAYNPEAELFQSLEKLGISIFAQDGSGITSETTQVVFSTAIEADNPDLRKSKTLSVPLLHRSEFLKLLVGDNELIAVAGTAGKTTTTGMLGWIFQCLEMDPSVYNGAAVANWKQGLTLGNVLKGNSNLWIIEADESDKSFLNFNPTHSIITNISKDHYELNELHSMFDQFEDQTSGITIRGTGKRISVPMIGKHNEENAACALELCKQLGFDESLIRKALSEFKGIERRLETVGEVNGVTIIDDYAHNPAKIAASLSAVAEKFKAVHAFWRPHGFKPLAQGLEEFAEVFSNHWKKCGGSIFILPVYYAGGTTQHAVRAEDLVDRLKSAGVPAMAVADYRALKHELKTVTSPGDAIIGMGARDPELPLFARRLITEWKKP